MYKIDQTQVSVVILHAMIRCVDCCAGINGMLWINVTTGIHARFVWNLKEINSYRPRSKLERPI